MSDGGTFELESRNEKYARFSGRLPPPNEGNTSVVGANWQA